MRAHTQDERDERLTGQPFGATERVEATLATEHISKRSKPTRKAAPKVKQPKAPKVAFGDSKHPRVVRVRLTLKTKLGEDAIRELFESIESESVTVTRVREVQP